MANLGRLGTSKFCSQSALAEILKEVAENGLPSAISRRSIKRARVAEIDFTTQFGPLLQEKTLRLVPRKNGKKFLTLPLVHPLAFLEHLCSTCEEYADEVKQMADRGTELRIVVYNDEVSPGNVLRHANMRKLQVIYWSFADHSMSRLSEERTWFLLTFARSELVRRLPGGVSEFFKESLLAFRQPLDIRHGVQLTFCDGSRRILQADLSIFLGVEAALKDCLGFKGASGTKLCPCCTNVVDHKADLVGPSLLPSTSLDVNLWVPQTDEGLGRVLAWLAEKYGRVTKEEFKRMQQYTGWNHIPTGALLSDELKLKGVSLIMYDWMHCYVSAGVWQHELTRLLKRLKEARLPQSELHDSLQAFRFPKAVSSRSMTGQGIFEKEQAKNSSLVSCSASEALSIYSVLRFLLLEKLSEGKLQAVRPEIESYLRLCHVLDLLQLIKKGRCSASRLLEAITAHLKGYLAVYTAEAWTPKCHYCLHLAMQMSFHKCLLSCWCHERKHRMVKRYAGNQTNTTRNFEKSVMEEALREQLHLWNDLHEIEWHAPSRTCQSLIQRGLGSTGTVQVSKVACYKPGAKCHSGDVALTHSMEHGYQVCSIHFFARIDGKIYALVNAWQPLGSNEFSADKIQGHAFVDLATVLDTCVHRLGETISVVPSLQWLE